MSPSASAPDWIPPRWHRWIVPLLLAVSAALAATSLVRDSVTFDETSKLAAGMSYWQMSDFRLNAEHPPLGKLWAAVPLLFVEHDWPPPTHPGWVSLSSFDFGHAWLFESGNDPQQLVNSGRGMMVLLMLATALVVYALGRSLFGPDAGLIALALAALSPTLLAHGRVVGTDVPVALGCAATLLATARVLVRPTWPRLLMAGGALAATSVMKFSWPVVLPAVLVMALLTVLRKPPMDSDAPARPTMASRAGTVGGTLLAMGLSVWIGIWLCYGGQSTILPPAGHAEEDPTLRTEATNRIVQYWAVTLYHPDGTPRAGLVPATLRTVAQLELLPEAYVYGAALTTLSTQPRPAYLCGQYSDEGWWYYFPVAAALKTPVPMMLLIAAGIVTVLCRWRACQSPILLVGCMTFVVCYAALAMLKGFNIGHRHVLPMYPVLFALAGASAVGLRQAWPRWLLGSGFVWLLIVSLWAWPQYLGYYNMLIGGPRHGHDYLLDSNTDWGQHLIRLSDYARAHPDEDIKLAYFGSADPTHYLRCTALPSHYPFTPTATLDAGTYVVSVNQLYGLYDPEIRDAFWTPTVRAAYEQLGLIAASTPGEGEPPERAAQRVAARSEYADLRAKRLLNRLRHMPPHDRVGNGLFLYRLTEADVTALTAP